ncbi:acetyltransferase (GNAT) family protein [Penicillium angulare]|uniref:acetyltransferase (GNAT) family protein n=1 Tax=Penicillium angulare TaxID=116970 RepID=UPI0025419FB7|nr:acetyltransferase (GNAT) family protein [Penicillium angulare]KAJ5272737.1 acetyltransferase (GNAT) family protein [Penicillium angulare]
MSTSNKFHVRNATLAGDDAQFIIAAFDSTLPYLASIGAGGMWGEQPFSQKDGFEEDTVDSVRKSEQDENPPKVMIVEIEILNRVEGQERPQDANMPTRVGAAVVLDSLPSYLTAREELKNEINKEKKFLYLEVIISDFRTDPLHRGAGAALIEAVKDYGRVNKYDTLYVDCWAGNGGRLNK